MIAATGFQRSIGGQGLAGFDDFGVARKDEAGQHERLGAGAAFGKSAFDQELIDTNFGGRFWFGIGHRIRQFRLFGPARGAVWGLFVMPPHPIAER